MSVENNSDVNAPVSGDIVQDGRQADTTMMDLTTGKRSLNYVGEDIFYKLVKQESRPVKIESAPVYFRGADGNTYDTRRYKVGIRNGKLAGIVSNKYTFISNEKVYQLIEDAGFKPTNAEFGSGGNSMFVQVFSDDLHASRDAHVWSNDNQNGDKVEVGLMVRNSIDGTAAFGGDIFTYRSRCSNGAIIGKKSLGSFSVKHVGEYSRLLAVFRAQLNRAFELSTKVKTFYQKSTEVRMNQQLAESLVQTKVPQKFLPDFVSIEDKKTVLHNKDATVWETFNSMTEKAWHADIGITTRRQYTERANAWLINVTEPLLVA